MHAEQYYRDLMNAEIDGVITEEEARILAERLRTDPRARKYYDELRLTVSLLDGEGEVSPPAGLRERILGALGGDRAAKTPQPAGPERRTWRGRRYIPAFAAGLAAGLILFAAVLQRPGTPVSPDRSGGSIGTGDGVPAVQETIVATFEEEGIWGSVAASFDTDGTAVTLRISADTEATALFTYGDGVEFDGIFAPGAPPFQMEADRETLLLVHRGAGEYTIRLRGGGRERDTVDLKIFSDQRLVARIPVGGQ